MVLKAASSRGTVSVALRRDHAVKVPLVVILLEVNSATMRKLANTLVTVTVSPPIFTLSDVFL